MAAEKLFLVAVVLVIIPIVFRQTSSCPIFGTERESRLSQSNYERIFMNFEAPSQCSGNVTSWRFCFYRDNEIEDDDDDIRDSDNFDAIFAVYRRQSTTSDNYVLVEGSDREKTLQWRTVKTSRFACMDEDLSSQDYFEIQENDIVGACIKDVSSRYPLLLVGRSSGSNFRTYQWNKSGYQSCTQSEISSVNTADSDFRQRDEYVLHLYANVAVAASCRAGDNPPSADARTSGLSGTYLNVGSPVTSCGNHIIKWHYCYYTEAATPGSTLSMTVAVWSLDQETSTYIFSPGSNLAISLTPVQTLAKIFCVEASLSEDNLVLVSEGDLIGVVLPAVNAIPIVSSNTNSPMSISRHSQNDSPMNLTLSEFSTLSNSALHLYATLTHRDLPTTPPPTTLAATEPETASTAALTTSESTTSESTTEPLTSQPLTTLAATEPETASTTMTNSEPTTELLTSQPSTTLAATEPETASATMTTSESTTEISTSQSSTTLAATEPETASTSMTNSESTTELSTSQLSTTLAATEPETASATMATLESTTELSTSQPSTTLAATEPETASTTMTNSKSTTELSISQLSTTLAATEPETASTTLTTSESTTELVTSQPSTQAGTEVTSGILVIESAATNSETSSTSNDNEKTSLLTDNGATTGLFNVAERDDQHSQSLGGGYLAAIILAILLVFGGVLLVAFVIVYVKKRKYTRKFSTKTRPGFDNVLYSTSGEPGQEGHISIYDSIAEPYIYSDTMFRAPTGAPKPSQQSASHSFLMDDDYYTQMDSVHGDDYYSQIDSVHAYQEELNHVRRGSAISKPESIYTDPGNNEDEIYSFLKKKKINHIPGYAITTGHHLGSGQFGEVRRGEWKLGPKQLLDVALKSLKEDASSSERVKFLQEAATMAQFRHPNVAAFYGVAKKDGQTLIVVELLSKGDLHCYLQTLIPDPGELVQASTPHLLLQFSQQISLGMSYLASTGFIHRDLAARNVLISDHLICKIADFGMSRDLNDDDYYTSSGGKIPLKWTAPEAIHFKKFSTASDVWSYGCVLYEIWSLGNKPFEGMGNVEVLRVLDTGGRLAPPPGCPKSIYQLMIQCWNPKPKQRPTFRDILMAMLENEDVVLHIPSEDASTHPQAATLAAPLKAGYNMYTDLQKTYIMST